MVGIGKELEAPAANGALEVVFDDVGRPLRLEEILQWTGAFCDYEDAFFNSKDQRSGEFQILARLLETQTLQEAVALWTGRHCNSLTLCQYAEA